MTQIATIQAQIAALQAQAKELAIADRKAQRATEVEDRKIEREFVRAMNAEFLAQDRAAAKAAKQAARELKAQRVAEIVAQLAAAGLTVRDLREAVLA